MNMDRLQWYEDFIAWLPWQQVLNFQTKNLCKTYFKINLWRSEKSDNTHSVSYRYIKGMYS